MDTFGNLFEVLWKLAIPVAAVSFLMVWTAMKKGLLGETSDLKALRKELDSMSKRHKEQRKDKKQETPKLNAFHGKWMKFGGGFYGTVALYTYGLIEFREIRDTIAGFGGIPPFLEALDVRMFVRMIIEALMNFITAITWPVYWIREFGSHNMWVWMLVAYGAYWLGMRLAQAQFTKSLASRDPGSG